MRFPEGELYFLRRVPARKCSRIDGSVEKAGIAWEKSTNFFWNFTVSE